AVKGIEGRSRWLPGWLPTPRHLRLRRALRRLDATLYRLIRQRWAADEEGDDILSALLYARLEQDGGRLTDRQVRDGAVNLFLAGCETTALALSWTWFLLAQHPRAAAELEAELEAVLGGRAPTAADLQRLRYAERVVLEALRLFPPAFA